jgi:hypothetical protein
VQSGKAAFADPADRAQPGAVGNPMAADVRGDAALAQKAPVGVEGVAAISEEPTDFRPRSFWTDS